MTAVASADLRQGRSITQWQQDHLWLRTDAQEEMPFFDNEGQSVLSKWIDEVIEISASWHQPVRCVLAKPRRDGWTSKLAARIFTRAATERNLACRYVNTTERDALDTFRVFLTFFDKLEKRVQPVRRSKESMRDLDFTGLGSRIDTAYASTPGTCRGLGYGELLLDELAKIQDVLSLEDAKRLIFGAILPSVRFGNFWGLFTPDGDTDIAYHIWKDAVSLDEARRGVRPKNGFIRLLLTHWQSDQCRTRGLGDDELLELASSLSDEETGLLDKHGIRDPEERAQRIHWRRQQIGSLGELFWQEFAEDEDTMWLSAGDLFFDARAIKAGREAAEARRAAAEEAGKPWRYEMNGRLAVYCEPTDDDDYIVFTDACRGVRGGDPAGIFVLSLFTGEEVASFRGVVEPDEAAEISVELAERYNEALWAPEIDGPGQACLLHGMKVLEYARVYRHQMQEKIGGRPRHEYGWHTTAVTRPALLQGVRTAVRKGHIQINSSWVWDDLRAFRLNPKRGLRGGYEAAAGAHDEGVIVAGGAWYIREHGGMNPKVDWV